MMKFIQPSLRREHIFGETGTADQQEMERYQIAQQEAERVVRQNREDANRRRRMQRIERRIAAQERRRQQRVRQ